MTAIPTPAAEEWRWWCRLCGASGSAPSEIDRDAYAFGHISDCAYGDPRHEHREFAVAGHLLHVWSW